MLVVSTIKGGMDYYQRVPAVGAPIKMLGRLMTSLPAPGARKRAADHAQPAWPRLSVHVFACGAHGQGAVEDAFLLAEGVGQSPDGFGIAADHDHLGAKVVGQVDVGAGQDFIVVVVLDVDEFVTELAGVVVVDQVDGADDLLVGVGPLLLDELLPDGVADELGSVGVAGGFDEPFELVGQGFFQGHAQSDEFGHG